MGFHDRLSNPGNIHRSPFVVSAYSMDHGFPMGRCNEDPTCRDMVFLICKRLLTYGLSDDPMMVIHRSLAI